MKRSREVLSLDLIPLIDVVLFLLIFFMVATVFKKDELALNLSLPKSAAEAAKIDKEQITLEVSKDYVAYNGKIKQIAEFEQLISEVVDKQKPVIVRIDKDVQYERVVKILDILQKNNLVNLSLITD